jgi:hypothetical protein
VPGAHLAPVESSQPRVLSTRLADTARGAQASVTVYSLIETAKANGLEPHDYLRHVLQHIAAADTVEKIEALLPCSTSPLQWYT